MRTVPHSCPQGRVSGTRGTDVSQSGVSEEDADGGEVDNIEGDGGCLLARGEMYKDGGKGD